MFWDSSAIVPYLVPEAASRSIASLLESDGDPLVWWAASVECISALERSRREGRCEVAILQEARTRLAELLEECTIVQPHPDVREKAERLLAIHPLRAADALHLAAALVACDDKPRNVGFVTLDDRLGEAAGREGFLVLPDQLS